MDHQVRRRRRPDTRHVIGFLLLFLLSAVFIFSATAKLIAIEPFEWTFMDLGLPYAFAAFVARFFIGFEYLIALFLLAHFYLKRITYPATIAFLGVLTVYLVLILVQKGNKGDCGCFGDALPMSPAMGILKNIGLIALTYTLVYLYPVKPYRFQAILSVIGGLGCMVIPFIVMPNSQKQVPVNLDVLYRDNAHQPAVELRKGKHLLAFMSLGCPHCRTAARILKKVYDEDSTAPIFLVLSGPESGETEFFNDTRAEKIPHMLFRGNEDFIRMAGPYVPALYWIDNSIKERKISPHQVTTELLQDWRR